VTSFSSGSLTPGSHHDGQGKGELWIVQKHEKNLELLLSYKFSRYCLRTHLLENGTKCPCSRRGTRRDHEVPLHADTDQTVFAEPSIKLARPTRLVPARSQQWGQQGYHLLEQGSMG